MDWFRWYHGAVSDTKWPLIMRKSGQSRCIVLAIWVALLEHASQAEVRGSINDFDVDVFDALFELEEGTTQKILDAMQEKHMIVNNHLHAWTKRQYETENKKTLHKTRSSQNTSNQDSSNKHLSTPRVQAHRARKKAEQERMQQLKHNETQETYRSDTEQNISEHTRYNEGRKTRARELETKHKNQQSKNNIANEISCDIANGTTLDITTYMPSIPKTDIPSKAHPQWSAFLSCWQVYPVQQAQEEAWREWMRLYENGTLSQPFVIREAILVMKDEDSRWLRGKIPNMARWLYGKGWNDKPFKEPYQRAEKQIHTTNNNTHIIAKTQYQRDRQHSQNLATALLHSKQLKECPHVDSAIRRLDSGNLCPDIQQINE